MSGDHDLEGYFIEQEDILVSQLHEGLITREEFDKALKLLRRESLRDIGYD
jgi:predicted RNA-binding protein associated with RNAse of E/G family